MGAPWVPERGGYPEGHRRRPQPAAPPAEVEPAATQHDQPHGGEHGDAEHLAKRARARSVRPGREQEHPGEVEAEADDDAERAEADEHEPHEQGVEGERLGQTAGDAEQDPLLTAAPAQRRVLRRHRRRGQFTTDGGGGGLGGLDGSGRRDGFVVLDVALVGLVQVGFSHGRTVRSGGGLPHQG